MQAVYVTQLRGQVNEEEMMSGRMLKGPFPLSERAIDHVIPSDGPGVYLLGSARENEFHPIRVGKATESLQAHLSAYVGRYASFEFARCESSDDAFDLVCRLYHRYHPSDNDAHPLPTNDSFATCPVCSRGFGRGGDSRVNY